MEDNELDEFVVEELLHEYAFIYNEVMSRMAHALEISKEDCYE